MNYYTRPDERVSKAVSMATVMKGKTPNQPEWPATCVQPEPLAGLANFKDYHEDLMEARPPEAGLGGLLEAKEVVVSASALMEVSDNLAPFE